MSILPRQLRMRDDNGELFVTDIPDKACIVTAGHSRNQKQFARKQRRNSDVSLKRHRRKRTNVLCLKRSNSMHSNDVKFSGKFVKFSAVLNNFPFLI